MTIYLWFIVAYLGLLTVFNFMRAHKVKTQEDMMVAGRSLPMRVMVFTLICTWIGSGTFIAGAEYAAKAGFSSLWMAAGAWVGIIAIYFLAGRIRTFGQYTIGDILEVRYGPVARVLGAIALIISFTAIVSYQFVAGGFILNVITDGKISEPTGIFITAAFVIVFTALAGMIAVAYTDLPNGIIILLACITAVPFVYAATGGLAGAQQVLPAEHFQVVNQAFGDHPYLKAGGYFLSTMLLLLGIQSMYQKFYSAKTPKDAKQAVLLWTLGTVVVEIVVVAIAVFAYSKFQDQLDLSVPKEGGKLVLLAAKELVPTPIGILLLGAACAVVISTGMNYLLSPTTNIMRDVYQRFIKPDASQKSMVALQKTFVVLLGVVAYFLATQLQSVLAMSFFAYTIYGVAITPALIAALAWKRATKQAGVLSILFGIIITLGLKIFTLLNPEQCPDGDPFGIPLIFPALLVSLLTLVVVTYLTPAPDRESMASLFPEKSGG